MNSVNAAEKVIPQWSDLWDSMNSHLDESLKLDVSAEFYNNFYQVGILNSSLQNLLEVMKPGKPILLAAPPNTQR